MVLREVRVAPRGMDGGCRGPKPRSSASLKCGRSTLSIGTNPSAVKVLLQFYLRRTGVRVAIIQSDRQTRKVLLRIGDWQSSHDQGCCGRLIGARLVLQGDSN